MRTDTDKKTIPRKNLPLMVAVIVLFVTIQFFSKGDMISQLPVKTFAGKAMVMIFVGVCVLLGCILSAFSSLNISKAVYICLYAGLAAVAVMIIFFVISFYFIASAKAGFSYISYKYFMHIDQVENAKAAIIEALHTDEQNSLYWRERGNLCVAEEDYQGSLYYYNKAVEYSPDSDDALFARGCAYLKNHDLENAWEDLNTVVENCPGNAQYNYEFAKVYYFYGLEYDHENKDNFEYALNYCTEAINIDSKNEDYYCLRADIYVCLSTDENYLLAIDDLTEAINLHVDNDDYFYRRGKVYVYLNEDSCFSEAVDDFTEAIGINRDNAEYYWWRGRALYELKKYEEAIDDFDVAISLNAENAEYYYWKAQAYGKLENADEEKENIHKAIEYNSENPAYHFYLGALCYEEQDYENAIKEYRFCTNIVPDNAWYYFNLGDAYYMSKQYKRAIKAYSKAIESDHTNILYLSRRSYCYYLVGNTAKMKEDVLSIMETQSYGTQITVE